MRHGDKAPWPAVILAGLLLASALSLPAAAEPPRGSSWGTQELEGSPVSAGFLDAGFLVVATGDAGGSPLQGAPAQCAGANDDADLYLISFPDGDGCLQTLDTSSSVGQEGVVAAAFASPSNRVVLGLPQPISGTAPNVVAYDLDASDRLQPAWRATVSGSVLDVATDPGGTTTAVVSQEGRTHRLAVFDTGGDRIERFGLPGLPRAVDVSEDGRFVGVAGNFTQGTTTFGWVRLYDLSVDASANPVLDQEVRQAESGVVESVSASNTGAVAAGTAGGQALLFPPIPEGQDQISPSQVDLGNATVLVQLSSDARTLVAAADDTVSRLTGLQGELSVAWSHQVSGPATTLVLQAPYVYVEHGSLTALDLGGHALWERPGAPVVGVNSTGLGLALATRVPGGTAADQDRTSVAGFSLHRNLTVQQVGAEPTIPPGDIGVLNVSIENTGAAILNVTLDPQGPGGVTASALTPWLVLRPGQTGNASVSVEVSAGAIAGPAEVPLGLSAQPSVDLSANQTTNLTFTVGAATDLRMRLQPGIESKRSVVQGQNTTLAFVVENRGNTPAATEVEIDQFPTFGDPWPVRLSPSSSFTVARDSVTTLLLQITVPLDAKNGTRNHIIVRASTADGTTAASADLVVNPFEALDLTPHIRTKKLAPGGEAIFTFSLQNLGSIASNVSAAAQAIGSDGAPYVPAGWSVILEPGQALLGPEESRTLTLLVAGPPGAEEGDRLRIQVVAATPEGARTTSIAFAVVDPALADDDGEEPKREPLGLLAPILGLLAASAVARRRSA